MWLEGCSSFVNLDHLVRVDVRVETSKGITTVEEISPKVKSTDLVTFLIIGVDKTGEKNTLLSGPIQFGRLMDHVRKKLNSIMQIKQL